jgi:hypothetical protein
MKKNKEANQSLSVKRKELGMLDKGTIACALIASSDYPDVLIPVKCKIEDAYFIDLTLFYSIKIMLFYDKNSAFLLEHIRNRKFKTLKGNNSYRVIKLSDSISNIDELNNYFNDKMKGTRFQIESCFVKKTKPEIFRLFDRIQEYLIFKHLRIVESFMSRGLYSGPLYMKNELEFKIRMERAFGSLFESSDEAKKYFDYLYLTNTVKRRQFDEQSGISSKNKDI